MYELLSASKYTFPHSSCQYKTRTSCLINDGNYILVATHDTKISVLDCHSNEIDYFYLPHVDNSLRITQMVYHDLDILCDKSPAKTGILMVALEPIYTFANSKLLGGDGKLCNCIRSYSLQTKNISNAWNASESMVGYIVSVQYCHSLVIEYRPLEMQLVARSKHVGCEAYLVVNASDCDYHIYEATKSQDKLHPGTSEEVEEYGLHRTKHREQLKNLWNWNEEFSADRNKIGVFDFMKFLQPTRAVKPEILLSTNRIKVNFTLITCIRYEITDRYAQLLIALSNGHIYVKYFCFSNSGSCRLSSANSYECTAYRMLLLHGAISCMQFVNTGNFMADCELDAELLSDLAIIGRVTDGEVAMLPLDSFRSDNVFESIKSNKPNLISIPVTDLISDYCKKFNSSDSEFLHMHATSNVYNVLNVVKSSTGVGFATCTKVLPSLDKITISNEYSVFDLAIGYSSGLLCIVRTKITRKAVIRDTSSKLMSRTSPALTSKDSSRMPSSSGAIPPESSTPISSDSSRMPSSSGAIPPESSTPISSDSSPDNCIGIVIDSPGDNDPSVSVPRMMCASSPVPTLDGNELHGNIREDFNGSDSRMVTKAEMGVNRDLNFKHMQNKRFVNREESGYKIPTNSQLAMECAFELRYVALFPDRIRAIHQMTSGEVMNGEDASHYLAVLVNGSVSFINYGVVVQPPTSARSDMESNADDVDKDRNIGSFPEISREAENVNKYSNVGNDAGSLVTSPSREASGGNKSNSDSAVHDNMERESVAHNGSVPNQN